MFLGVVLPWLYLSYKAGQRRKAFMAALPDTLQLMAGSLSAGYSMPQAVDTVVREGKPPISTEFNRALVETRLGVDLEDALDGIAERMQSVDFAWVVMAIRIQREVGGNLAEVLTTVSATLRERERLRRQVQVLSAEGRLSAWILGLLPVVFALYLVLVRPEYLEPLVTHCFGWMHDRAWDCCSWSSVDCGSARSSRWRSDMAAATGAAPRPARRLRRDRPAAHHDRHHHVRASGRQPLAGCGPGDGHRPRPDEGRARPAVRRPGDRLRRWRRLTRLGRRFTAGDQTDRIKRKLDLAGNPPSWDVDRVIAFKVLGLFAGLVARDLLLGVARRRTPAHRWPSPSG